MVRFLRWGIDVERGPLGPLLLLGFGGCRLVEIVDFDPCFGELFEVFLVHLREFWVFGGVLGALEGCLERVCRS